MLNPHEKNRLLPQRIGTCLGKFLLKLDHQSEETLTSESVNGQLRCISSYRSGRFPIIDQVYFQLLITSRRGVKNTDVCRLSAKTLTGYQSEDASFLEDDWLLSRVV